MNKKGHHENGLAAYVGIFSSIGFVVVYGTVKVKGWYAQQKLKKEEKEGELEKKCMNK